MTDRTFASRLYPNEEKHLRDFWEGNFSNFVHSAFKDDMLKIKNNRKKYRVQTYAQSIVLVGIGLFFLFSLFNISFASLSWFMVMALGTCFSVWGIINLSLEVKEHRSTRRNR